MSPVVSQNPVCPGLRVEAPGGIRSVDGAARGKDQAVTTDDTAARGGGICKFQVTLLDVDPPVWRRFTVLRDLTLADLHHVIQAVMGWSDVHLHEFVTADGCGGPKSHPPLSTRWGAGTIEHSCPTASLSGDRDFSVEASDAASVAALPQRVAWSPYARSA